MRVGYVVKRYPRYSETFIVTEILAHEAAGLDIEIFSLRPPLDSHFQDTLARVRAPVTYIAADGVKTMDFWAALEGASQTLPEIWTSLQRARGENHLDVFQAVVLAREVRARGIEHLHAHFGTLPTSVARLAAQFAEVPYTFTAHAKDIYHESVRIEELTRKLWDSAAMVTVSDFNLRHLGRTCAIDGRVHRIYNGLDLDRFPYQDPLERAPIIVAVGRLIEKKGFADLIDACALLAARDRAFECRIIGSGETERTLRARIEERGLRERVALIGPRPQREVAREVQGASLLAAPCVVGSDGDRDGLPTVLLEAMALGTPCVATDVTGIPELIHDEATGLLVPQHDPAALAAAIERLLANAGERVRLARAARRLIEAEFDIRRNAEALRRIFFDVRGGQTPAPPMTVRHGVGASRADWGAPLATLGNVVECGD